MLNLELFNQPFNPLIKMYRFIRYDLNHKKEHPDEFPFHGMDAIVGEQGAGKTVLLVDVIHKLKLAYPKLKILTNIKMTDMPFNDIDIIEYKENKQIIDIENGEYGVLIALDEAQSYFGNYMAKGNINMELYRAICTERAAHKLFLMTTQRYNRLDKKIREQVDYIILSRNTFLKPVKFLQIVKAEDTNNEDTSGDTLSGKVLRHFHYILTPDMFTKYDTFQWIRKANWSNGEDVRGEIN